MKTGKHWTRSERCLVALGLFMALGNTFVFLVLRDALRDDAAHGRLLKQIIDDSLGKSFGELLKITTQEERAVQTLVSLQDELRGLLVAWRIHAPPNTDE